MVHATIRYVAPMAERPFFYLYDPPPGTPARNTRGDRRVVAIRDARELVPAPTLDVEGFTLVAHRTAVDDLWDAERVRRAYYPEMEALVRRVTDARRVLAFDHNVRSAPRAERREDGAQAPVRFPHNDYTERSAPQRVRDLVGGAEADELLTRRFAVVNAWKPIGGPALDTPLAFCEARSIAHADLVPTDLRYRDRSGEIYSLRFNPEQRWFHYSAMTPDEVLLLKCYDADPTHASFTAHSAFDHPNAPAGARPRESIEVRTLVFF